MSWISTWIAPSLVERVVRRISGVMPLEAWLSEASMSVRALMTESWSFLSCAMAS